MLNARLTSAFSEAKYVYDGNGAKKLLQEVGELLQLKASVLDEFPPVFGAAFIDVYLNLKWVDNALRQADSMGWNARDVLRSLLNAISFKQKLEQILAKPHPGPFSVGIGVMHDHDPPQPQSPAGSGFEWRAGGGIAVHHARRSMVCGF